MLDYRYLYFARIGQELSSLYELLRVEKIRSLSVLADFSKKNHLSNAAATELALGKLRELEAAATVDVLLDLPQVDLAVAKESFLEVQRLIGETRRFWVNYGPLKEKALNIQGELFRMRNSSEELKDLLEEKELVRRYNLNFRHIFPLEELSQNDFENLVQPLESYITLLTKLGLAAQLKQLRKSIDELTVLYLVDSI